MGSAVKDYFDSVTSGLSISFLVSKDLLSTNSLRTTPPPNELVPVPLDLTGLQRQPHGAPALPCLIKEELGPIQG